MDARYSRPGRLRTHTRRRFFLGRGGGAPSLSSITISGLAGITSWPSYNRVEHVQPTASVLVDVSRYTSEQAVITLSTEGVVDASYTSINGIITIPADAIATAVNDKKRISLRIGNNSVGGYIIFLPRTESEVFTEGKALSSNGVLTDFERWSATVDFIDITYASDIVYSGRQSGSSLNALVAYDENQEFVRNLIEIVPDDSVIHVVPDGSYKYVRACGVTASDPSLMLVFPDRRKRKSDSIKNKSMDAQNPGEQEDP